MKKEHIILVLFLSSLLIAGCVTNGGCWNRPDNPDNPPPNPPPVEIIEPEEIAPTYYAVYTNSAEDLSHVRLSSMFKYYLESARDNENSWSSLRSNLNDYVAKTTNTFVHVNYPEKATVKEAEYLRQLGQTSIASIEDELNLSAAYVVWMEDILAELIIMMNRYEYDRDTE